MEKLNILLAALLVIGCIVIFLFYKQKLNRQKKTLERVKSIAIQLNEKNREQSIRFLEKKAETIIEFLPEVFSEKQFKDVKQFLYSVNYRFSWIDYYRNEGIFFASYLENDTEKKSEEDPSKEDLKNFTNLLVKAILN